MTLPLGIDVASYQGRPDWTRVRQSGVQFAFTKATESTDYVNPTFAYNWQGIKEVGLIRGAYHYARPDTGSTIDEVQHFIGALDRVGGLEPGDLLALDIESGTGFQGGWALNFVKDLEQHYGFKPLIYTGDWFAGPAGFARVPELAQYGLWLAAYQERQPPPTPPWEFFAFWQYSARGRIDGIDGFVDVNYFNGSVEDIPLYGYQAPSPPIPPPMPPPPEPAPDLQAEILKLQAQVKKLEDSVEAYATRLKRIREKSVPSLVREIDRLRKLTGDIS